MFNEVSDDNLGLGNRGQWIDLCIRTAALSKLMVDAAVSAGLKQPKPTIITGQGFKEEGSYVYKDFKPLIIRASGKTQWHQDYNTWKMHTQHAIFTVYIVIEGDPVTFNISYDGYRACELFVLTNRSILIFPSRLSHQVVQLPGQTRTVMSYHVTMPRYRKHC